jgi:AcrR family transcriptional regulator
VSTKQAEKRARTRLALLDAAHSTFGRRGYHGATLREIAAAAGVSTGALYYNFATKEDLFLALLETRMDERVREIEAAYAAEGSSAAGLGRSSLDYVENLKRNRDWIALFFEFAAHAARNPEFGIRFGERFRRFWQTLAALVEQRAREQDVELPLPPEQTAIAIDLIGLGFMLPQIIDPDAVPDDLLGKTLSYMLRGMAQDAQRASRPRSAE